MKFRLIPFPMRCVSPFRSVPNPARLRFVLFAVMLGHLTLAQAGLRMPAIFSDGMVLQRDRPVWVWGWSEPGDEVTVQFAGQEKRGKSGADGRWEVQLEPMAASFENREIRIQSLSGGAKTIRNVWVGEVWFTAGQSNMMMGISHAVGGEEFFKARQPGGFDGIRVVNQLGPFLFQKEPQTDIAAVWGAPTQGYSAVSLWFADKLFQHFESKVPVGMITYTAIYPAEGWVRKDLLEGDPRLKTVFQDALKQDAELFNGVISAIAPYSMRGAVYYQAEYNGNRALQFRTLFPALIACWREAWRQPEMPFLFVQLPGFIAVDAPSGKMDMDPATLAEYKRLHDRKTWTEIRESQLHTWQKVPNTGMAVTIDVGESYDIHPPKKEPVAERLVLQARKVAYGEDLVADSPVPKEIRRESDGFVISFDHAGAGLSARGGKLEGFEVAGVDLNYVPASAEIRGNTVVVKSPRVPDPVHVRYAWDGNPVATLENSAGLPASPFRHIDWSRSPQPARSTFAFPNPAFEELNPEGVPTWWVMDTGAASIEGGSGNGKRAVLLPTPGKSGVRANKIALGTGGFWNAPPLESNSLRPGSLVTYTADLASSKEGAEARLYMNLSADFSGGGYQAWGGMQTASTTSADFTTRRVVQRTTDKALDAVASLGSNAGVRFVNQSGNPDTGVLIDNLSEVEILRPTLSLSSMSPIDFGTVAPGRSAENQELIVWNGQAEVRAQQLTASAPTAPVATILYGTASFQSDAMREEQKVVEPTDHVGALIFGPQSDAFEFIGPHAAGPHALKFVGSDGMGGLHGGPEPEKQAVTVRFKGTEQAGKSEATLRIVTQAGNVGRLSQGAPGEPPVSFYYVDIPLLAEVR
jgi:sialate O-acetylesterase